MRSYGISPKKAKSLTLNNLKVDPERPNLECCAGQFKDLILVKHLLWLCALTFHLTSAEVDLSPTKKDMEINTVIRAQLTRYHFNRYDRPINDEFSELAFENYLKRIDYKKQLLLKEDVEKLAAYKKELDDDLMRNRFHLPEMAGEMIEKNLDPIEFYITKELMKEEFDFESGEDIELDPEKIDFCETMEELLKRWANHVKFQVMSRYLNTLESEKASKKAKLEEKNENSEEDKKELSEEEKEKQIVIDEIKKKELVQKAKDWVLENSLTKYFKRQRELSHQDHYSNYFNALTAVYDPHTNYLDPQAKEDFDIRMSKSLEGIGAVLEQNDDFTKVTRIIPGSASHRQGELKAGDVIMRVAQDDEEEEVDLTGMDLREVVSYIRGPKGSKVRLTVKTPNNEIKVIPIIRDIVKLEDRLARSTMLESRDHQKIGYVYLPDFYRDHKHNTKQNCTDDVKKEVLKLKEQGMQGLIFDLRDNGGGFLEDAKSISGLFIKSGPVVQVKSFNGHVNVLHDLDRDIVYDGPMVVLVNQFSASASEILAAALQDYGRAIIVGSGQTHGKGTVQHLVPLNLRMPPPMNREPMGDLKLTIQKFYRVNGGSTQNKGVIPDIILPDERDHLETGERHLDNALPWDSISAQPYYEWKEPLPLDLLRAKSEERLAKSDIFKAIIERSEKLKDQSEDTQVHLSISQMTDEREQRMEENKAYGELIKKLKEKIDKETGVESEPEKEESKTESKESEEAKSLTVEEEKEEEYKTWSKNIGYDPHVRESVHILQDFIHTRKIAGTLGAESKAKATP